MSALPDATPWETMGPADAVRELEGGPDGLSETEAVHRLNRDGPNALPRKDAPSFPFLFARQFASPLIAILALAAVFAAVISEWVDAGFIGGVLLLNAIIGAVQEYRAERSAHALQGLLTVTAVVERDGNARALNAAQLVVGDLVVLESGQAVPADLRLLQAHAVEVDESLLTGESIPVAKDASWIAEAPMPAAECQNMAFAGSMMVRGRATGIVVATATRTQVGRIATDLRGRETAPPLLVRMKRFARVVGFVAVGAAVLLAGVGILAGNDVREMVLFAVAVAVSAVPEGLPVALTVALAIGTTRMARRRVVVRRLAAVEGLGSCTVIATDKTGTLTMNALTVREVRAGGQTFAVSGEGFVPEGQVTANSKPLHQGDNDALDALARAVVLCNEAELLPSSGSPGWSWRGDPTDVALLSLAAKMGMSPTHERNHAPLVADIAFEPERRFAASHRAGDAPAVYVKGAPERVLPMCAGVEAQGAMAEAEAMAEQGLRVLAIAAGPSNQQPGVTPVEPANLQFLGYVGMNDPPRPGVRESIEQATAAGIRVVMITGDHPTTATAIAEAVGIPVNHVGPMTGTELDQLAEGELATRVADVSVFARVAPHQKVQVVDALQKAGHFVAVTGDGVNDAPALKSAHIGVAMGLAGTDVARDAADIVLTDDQFPSVVAGIEEGRVAYNNVRNVVFLLVSTGAAEIVLLFLALSTGSPLPLLPAQLLWLNLVTNGIQDVALGAEPGQGDELRQPPRNPRERIFNRIMIERTLLTALVMGVGGFVVFRWMIAQGWSVDASRNGLLLLMVLFENIHVGNSRSETRSAFALSPLRNPFLLWGVIGAQGLHIAALHIPFLQRVLHTQPVSWQTWGLLLVIALSLTLAFEAHKAWRRRTASRPHTT